MSFVPNFCVCFYNGGILKWSYPRWMAHNKWLPKMMDAKIGITKTFWSPKSSRN